jgi:hypothetical protein
MKILKIKIEDFSWLIVPDSYAAGITIIGQSHRSSNFGVENYENANHPDSFMASNNVKICSCSSPQIISNGAFNEIIFYVRGTNRSKDDSTLFTHKKIASQIKKAVDEYNIVAQQI